MTTAEPLTPVQNCKRGIAADNGWFLKINSQRALASVSIILCGLLAAITKPKIDCRPQCITSGAELPAASHTFQQPSGTAGAGGTRRRNFHSPLALYQYLRVVLSPGRVPSCHGKPGQGVYHAEVQAGESGSSRWPRVSKSCWLLALTKTRVGHEGLLLGPAHPAAGGNLDWKPGCLL